MFLNSIVLQCGSIHVHGCFFIHLQFCTELGEDRDYICIDTLDF